MTVELRSHPWIIPDFGYRIAVGRDDTSCGWTPKRDYSVNAQATAKSFRHIPVLRTVRDCRVRAGVFKGVYVSMPRYGWRRWTVYLVERMEMELTKEMDNGTRGRLEDGPGD